MPIGTLICDKSAIVRSGLRAIFDRENDIEIVSEIANWRDLNRALGAARLDVILLGAATELDLIQALDYTRSLSARPGVIAVHSGPSTVNLALHAYLAGASAVVEQENSVSDMPDVIRCVAGGGAVITPVIARRLLEMVTSMPHHFHGPDASLERLSVREREIFKHLVNGHSNAEIAKKLSIAEATVRSHVSHLLCKMNLKSRVDAVAFAYRRGFDMGNVDQ